MKYLFGRPHNTAMCFASAAMRLSSDVRIEQNQYLGFWHAFATAPDLTQEQVLYASFNGNVQLVMTPGGGLRGSSIGASGEANFFEISGADLAALGVNLREPSLLVIGLGQNALVWVNGVSVAFWQFISSGGGQGDFYLGGPATLGGSYMTGLSLWSFPSYSNEQLPTFSQLYNGGRGVNLQAMTNEGYCVYMADFETPYLAGYFAQRGSGMLTYAGVLPYFYFVNRAFITGRKLGAQVTGTPLAAGSTDLSEYLYASAPQNQSYLGRTGSIRPSNGTTELPAQWTGEFNVGGNKLSGACVITRSWASAVWLHDQWPSQAPPNNFSLEWTGQQNELSVFYANNAKLIHLRLAGVPGKKIVVGTVDVRGNSLGEPITQVFDLATLSIEQAYFSGAYLPGPLVFWPGLQLMGSSNNGHTGPLPAVPDSLTVLAVNNNGLTRLPATLGNVNTFNGNNNAFSGVFIAPQCSSIRFGESGYIGGDYGHQAPSGYADDWLDLDLRAQQVDLAELIADGSKIRRVYWPDGSGKALVKINYADFNYNNAFGIEWANGWPSNVEFYNVFQAYRAGQQTNTVFPLGRSIRATTINLGEVSLSTASMNATLDSLIQYRANFAGPQTLKSLSLYSADRSGGFNEQGWDAALGFATRAEALRQVAEDDNWLMIVGHQNMDNGSRDVYLRIVNIYPFEAGPEYILLETNNNGYNLSGGRIQNTANYDGVWQKLGQGWGAGEATQSFYDLHNSNGNWFIYKLGDGKTYQGNETGILYYNA